MYVTIEKKRYVATSVSLWKLDQRQIFKLSYINLERHLPQFLGGAWALLCPVISKGFRMTFIILLAGSSKENVILKVWVFVQIPNR